MPLKGFDVHRTNGILSNKNMKIFWLVKQKDNVENRLWKANRIKILIFLIFNFCFCRAFGDFKLETQNLNAKPSKNVMEKSCEEFIRNSLKRYFRSDKFAEKNR